MGKFDMPRNVEKPTSNDGVLSLEEARKEANMIRGKLFEEKDADLDQTDIYRTRKKYSWEDEGDMDDNKKLREDGIVTYEFTTEDYKRVSEAIDKLKSELEAEPEIVKNLYKFGRLIHNTAKIVGVPIQFIDDAFIMYASYAVPGSRGKFGSYTEREKEGHAGFVAKAIQDVSDFVKKGLTDAVKRWKAEEKIGKNYEKTIGKQIKKEKNIDNMRNAA